MSGVNLSRLERFYYYENDGFFRLFHIQSSFFDISFYAVSGSHNQQQKKWKKYSRADTHFPCIASVKVSSAIQTDIVDMHGKGDRIKTTAQKGSFRLLVRFYLDWDRP